MPRSQSILAGAVGALAIGLTVLPALPALAYETSHEREWRREHEWRHHHHHWRHHYRHHWHAAYYHQRHWVGPGYYETNSGWVYYGRPFHGRLAVVYVR